MADVFCLVCRTVVAGQDWLTHRCAAVEPCVICGELVERRQYRWHRCVGDLMSTLDGPPSVASADAAAMSRLRHPAGRARVSPLRAPSRESLEGA